MDGFEAYKIYNAIKLHFTGSYDYFKYNGKTQVSENTFRTHKNKFGFYKLSRKYNEEELVNFLVANFLVDSNCWVGELNTEDAHDRYIKWCKINQSLSYIFEQDLEKMFDVDDPNSLIKVKNGMYPPLLERYNRREVCLETIVIMNDLMNFLPMWEKNIDDDIIFPSFAKIMKKYSPFLKYDKKKFKSILLNKVTENA